MTGGGPIQVDPKQFLAAFLDEATEHLETLEKALLDLEADPRRVDLVDEIFRAAHSIKGGAGTFGLPEVARFTHSLEGLLDRVRRGVLPPIPQRLALLLRAADVVRSMLQSARTGERSPAPPIEAILAALDLELATPPPPAPTATDYAVTFRPPGDVFRRGIDPLLVLRELATLGELVEVFADDARLPALTELEPDTSYLGWHIKLRSSRSIAELHEVFAFTDGAEVAVASAGASAAHAAHAGAPPPATAAGLAALESSTIRVPTDKVDCLMNLVGELVIAQSMVSQTVTRFTADRADHVFDLREAVAELERRTRELQERVIAIRMVPVGTLLGRFPRLVRDLALALDKQVVLELFGAETELDRGVIERITDPLTHLLRNAVDHGIERPAIRRSAGKPELGTITITARHQGGNIVIEVADDGGGLDGERLRQRAVQLGILRGDEDLTEDELLELVYRPGFSTASTVSDVSGRGVGLDVVHRNIQALHGSVRIRSELGRGTCFRIALPLTLAIVDGLCLAVGSESYVLPLVTIVESLRVPPEGVKTVAGRGETVMVRGEILPLVRLHRLFAVPPRVADPGRGIIVIVENEARRVALLVDDIQGQVQAVIKSLETNYRRVEGVMGATILGDGRIGLILDVVGLIRMAHTGRRAPAPAPMRART